MNLRKYLPRFFKSQPKSFLIDGTFNIIPAFELEGETYYMHEDPMSTATGRGLTAMVFMEELMMGCDIDYLKWHVAATKKIFSQKTIDLQELMRLNIYLGERIEMLAGMPENVFKMASVVFFTKQESAFRYDEIANKKKIARWMKAKDEMYDFFLRTPLKTLIPSLNTLQKNSPDFMKVQEKISSIHTDNLQKILSKNLLTGVSKN